MPGHAPPKPAPSTAPTTSRTGPATTATTAAPHHSIIPPPPHVPWGSFWLALGALPLLAALLVANRRLKASTPQTGGSGRVVGIVGRMGSGKSYMAVRMALRRLKRGANVVTNFSMNLHDAPAVNALAARGWRPRRIAAEMTAWGAFDGGPTVTVKQVKVLRGITGTWRQFRGWEQFAELENAVVIIDEAHLYAPSNKSLVFPDVARFKMSQARKFCLDVYWITQHENRVNAILKDLTNLMYVCRSWMTAAFFTVKGYEPEHMRKHGKHLERQGYRMNTAVAGLYNTLEILAADDHLMKSAGMEKAHAVAARYNTKVTAAGRRAAPVQGTAPSADVSPAAATSTAPARHRHGKGAGPCEACAAALPTTTRQRTRPRPGVIKGGRVVAARA